MLSRRRRRPPFSLFLSVEQQQCVEDLKLLQRKSPCLLGVFTAEFMNEFEIGTETANAALKLIMLLASTDTVKLECLHAWLRRLVMRLGVQVRRPEFVRVATLLLVQRCRARTEAITHRALSAATQDSAHDGGRDAEAQAEHLLGEEVRQAHAQAKRGGGGGQYRAFCSRMLKSGRAKNFK